MNELIRELHSQCKVSDEGKLLYFDYERFAELIIQECLNICEDMGDKGKDGHYCADKIAKTFRS
jgi:hypothetical protein